MKKCKTFLFLCGILLFLQGCNLDIPLENEFADPDAITNVRTARESLASIYADYPHLDFTLSTFADDFQPSMLIDQNISLHNNYRWYTSDLRTLAGDTWEKYYHTITLCNVLLLRIPEVQTINEQEKQTLQEIQYQTQTMKAMAYFDLLRLFATAYDQSPEEGIVLKDVLDVEFLSRSSKTQVCQVIYALLEPMLQVAWQQKETKQNTHWISWKAAQYLAMEVAVYQGEWSKVIQWGEALKGALPEGALSVQTYPLLWQDKTSPAMLFAWHTSSTYYTEIHAGDSEGDYLILNPSIDYVSNQDIRREVSSYSTTIQGKTVRGFGKYNKMNIQGTSVTQIHRMRASGVYLMLAEAYARTQQLQKAASLLMTYRTARGISATEAPILPAQALQAILVARHREFVGEGQRFFDLKRCHQEDLIRLDQKGDPMKMIKWNNYRWTWPIPASEYRTNQQIKQNEGWPKEVNNS